MKADRRVLLGVGLLLMWGMSGVHNLAAQDAADNTDPQAAEPDQNETAGSAAPAGQKKHRGDKAAGGLLGPDYVLGPEDVLMIEVFNLPEMKQTVRIENDGTISVKLLNRVKAAGLTAAQLEKELEKKWGKDYLEDPHVIVFVREAHAQPVSVVGAVDEPGIYQLTGHRTLIDMVALAGGLAKKTATQAGRTIYVTRKDGFGDLKPVDGMRQIAPDQVEIDLKKLFYSSNSGLNLDIKPFDTISVSKADIVYVVGAVKKPGGFVIEDRDNVTVLQALAMAEGFEGTPAKARTRIIRTLSNGSRTELPIDLGKIIKGKEDDPVLASSDILLIPDNTAKMIGRRGIEAAIGTVSGLLIYGRGF
jgi:polysaccharide biosynthesis/export protein